MAWQREVVLHPASYPVRPLRDCARRGSTHAAAFAHAAPAMRTCVPLQLLGWYWCSGQQARAGWTACRRRWGAQPHQQPRTHSRPQATPRPPGGAGSPWQSLPWWRGRPRCGSCLTGPGTARMAVRGVLAWGGGGARVALRPSRHHPPSPLGQAWAPQLRPALRWRAGCPGLRVAGRMRRVMQAAWHAAGTTPPLPPSLTIDAAPGASAGGCCSGRRAWEGGGGGEGCVVQRWALAARRLRQAAQRERPGAQHGCGFGTGWLEGRARAHPSVRTCAAARLAVWHCLP